MAYRLCLATVGLLATAGIPVLAQDAPATEPLSPQFQVAVDGKDAPVYLARICSLTADQRRPLPLPVQKDTTETSFASFDVAGPEKITITCHDPVQNAVVRPASRGITPVISGNTITFSVDKPGALVVDVNGDWVHSLQLFGNPPEVNVPHPGDPNVIYFGPGVHAIEHLEVRSGQTLYLAPGAVLYGKPTGTSPKASIVSAIGPNVTIRGRGIIDGSLCPRGSRGVFFATRANVTIEGIILRDSAGWNIPARQCNNLLIDNLKIFGWRGNSDGIDVCNCVHVEVKNCYLRTFDDLVVLKTDKGQGEEHDVRVHDCVLWNEFAHALSLGAEIREPISDIHFYDCDVVHDKGREWSLRDFNCDSAPTSNITWDNIRIEECRRFMSLWIGKAVWTRDAEPGHIADVTFRNITSVAPEVPDSIADLVGFDATHTIAGVKFDHVAVAGKPLTPADVKQNAFVSGVSVTP